jgi:intracellular multiplication protein IcmC
MAEAFIETIEAFRTLIFALAYLVGFFTVILAIYKAKDHVESPQQTPFRAPVVYFIVGVCCIYMPEFIKGMLQTFYDSSTITAFSYGQQQGQDGNEFYAAVRAIVMFVQLVGLIGFFRGILLLKALGQNGGQNQNGFGQALTHIIGGILAINVVMTAGLIASTFGMENPLENPTAFVEGMSIPTPPQVGQ